MEYLDIAEAWDMETTKEMIRRDAWDGYEQEERRRDAQDALWDEKRDKLIREGWDKIHAAGFNTIPGTESRLITDGGDIYLKETILVPLLVGE